MDTLLDKVVEKHGGRVTSFLESSFDLATQRFMDRLGLLLDALLMTCKFILGLLVAQTLALVCTCYVMITR